MNRKTAALRSTPLPIHCNCSRRSCNGEVVEFASNYAREIFIRCDPASVWPGDNTPRKQAASFYECVPWILRQADASMADVVLERVFFRNLPADFDVFCEARKRAYEQAGVGKDQLPVASYVGQAPSAAGRAFELQVYALVPESAETARVTAIPATNGHPPARIVEIGGGRHFYAQGITGRGDTFRGQCDTMFANASALLRRHGSAFAHVLRTWCYLDDIYGDYGAFNESRNEFFRQEKVSRLPASTGIGADLRPRGTRCAMDVYGFLNPEIAEIEVMHTPTLNEAGEYGSAFSRGMKVCLPEKTVLYVSGTASVDESGATAHVGDPRQQIERMLLNVKELLAPHGAGFSDLVQVISYLKSIVDRQLFRDVTAQWGLTDLPNSIVQANVCRPDLLCEMEAIAILPAPVR